MDPSMPRHLHSSLLQWVLRGLVIAGVLAMHVLDGHAAADARGVTMAMVGFQNAGTSMPGMDMPTAAPAVHRTRPVVAARPAVPTMQAAGGAGTDMSGEACCLLFLITGAAVAALALLVFGRRGAGSPGTLRMFPGTMASRRGPPGAPPRFSLCVLRI